MENFRLCRICISESHNNVMMSIFGEDALWKKIAAFADVHIEEGDNLPQQICMLCAKDAINACSFKQKCQDSDHFFRQQLLKKESIKNDVISISSSSDEEEEDNNDYVDIIQHREPVVKNSDEHKNQSGSLKTKDNIEKQKNFPTIIEDPVGIQNGTTAGDDSSKVGDGNPIEVNVTAGSSGNSSTTWSVPHLPNSDDMMTLIPEVQIHTPLGDSVVIPFKHVRGYQCNICFEFFAMKTILKHHTKLNHPDSNKVFECFECKKNYNSQRFLEKHVRLGSCMKVNKVQSILQNQKDVTIPYGSAIDNSIHNNCPTDTQVTVIAKKERKYYRGRKPGKKRGGRVRIQLNELQIDLAKNLIRESASTTKLARALGISRTFAWRLRKTMIENGVSFNDNNDVPNTIIASATHTVDTTEKVQGNSIEATIKIKEQVQCTTGDSEKPQQIYEKNQPHHKIEENKINIDISGMFKEQMQNDDEQLLEESREKSQFDNYSRPSCSQTDESATDADLIADSINGQSFDQQSSPDGIRKQRKPNVFMNDEKYARAKVLVANNATTMDVARHLNISQMSAWKLRDCIRKGIALTFKKPPAPRPKPIDRPLKRGRRSRPKLTGEERRERENRIQTEILSLINADSTIQYWKVSEILTGKGYPMSASSVCQRLKAMGIHRRWKPLPLECSESNISKVSSTDDEISVTGNLTI